MNLRCKNCLIERVYMFTTIFVTCLKNLKTLVQNRRETKLLAGSLTGCFFLRRK